ncbi:MAG: hypothetical protein HJJLKODD_02374 [Phycisphaerae bacterium]|nr:hypothetical protein [Phycisphaerae bacterium]
MQTVTGQRYLRFLVLVGAAAMLLATSIEAVRAVRLESKIFALPVIAGLTAAWMSRKQLPALLDRLLHVCSRPVVGWAMLLLPTVVQILFATWLDPQPASDYGAYWWQASHLRATGEYRYPATFGELQVAHKTPGMAIYLAAIQLLFGETVGAARMMNILLVLLSNLLMWRLATKIYSPGSRHDQTENGSFTQAEACGSLNADSSFCVSSAALLVTLLYAYWPSRWFAALLLGYDALLGVLLVSSWYLLVRSTTRPVAASFVSGLLLGAAILVRPSALLLIPVTLLASVSRAGLLPGRAMLIRRWGGVMVGVALLLTPWLVRNLFLLGQPVLSTQAGVSFYRSFHPQAGRYYTNAGYAELHRLAGGDELQMHLLGWREGGRFIQADPVAAMGRVARKWYTLLESDHEPAGLVCDAPGRALPAAVRKIIRSLSAGGCDLFFVWLNGAVVLAILLRNKSAEVKTRGSVYVEENISYLQGWVALFAIISGLVVHGLLESQPRYMLMYQCYWVVLAGWIIAEQPHE